MGWSVSKREGRESPAMEGLVGFVDGSVVTNPHVSRLFCGHRPLLDCIALFRPHACKGKASQNESWWWLVGWLPLMRWGRRGVATKSRFSVWGYRPILRSSESHHKITRSLFLFSTQLLPPAQRGRLRYVPYSRIPPALKNRNRKPRNNLPLILWFLVFVQKTTRTL